MHPLLILRIHSDLRLGLGHASRALVIQELWESLGGNAIIAVSGDEKARRIGAGRHPFLDKDIGCETADLGESLFEPLPQSLKDRASIILVDQWEITQDYLQTMRPLKIAVMEDDGDAHEMADLLFQPFLEGVKWAPTPVKTIDGRKVRPCETKRGSCRVVRGAEYVVVSQFASKQKPKREPSSL